ncbi:ectonucleotide pyrophosphatase/phosphodiesterase [Nitrospira sp. KM1]|uniref:alkaline phosphatase family protein n=1 Tax=Nitrospira sp. KM1 TaxID=1936990 RepID=UPI001E64A163|nr:ectonucleotide pyrophosphatase/phosphodiesterase [Nitrospira sp. KM1]
MLGSWLLVFSVFFSAASLSAEDNAAHTSGKQPRSATAEVNHPKHRRTPFVLLVSLDGFRADYLDRYDLPNFRRLMREGARAQGLIPVFPSVTRPNHYSIVTGLYPERHGIVGHWFYDPDREEVFDNQTQTDATWYRGDPIWAVAERHGMLTACYFWVGCGAKAIKIPQTVPTSFDSTAANEVRVDQVLSWLQLPDAQRPHFLTLYIGDVDDAGHEFGPDSPELQIAVEKVDRELGRLLSGLDTLEHRHQIYVIVVSDHGMAHADPKNFVWMDDLGSEDGVFKDGVWMGTLATVANLHLIRGKSDAVTVRDQINRRLKQGKAFLREDTPASLHYRKDPRIGDVVVLMDRPYLIFWKGSQPVTLRGEHGWNTSDPDMHGIFLARGPGIKRGSQISAFENVDIYPFIAELLNLKISQDIDGHPHRLKHLIME